MSWSCKTYTYRVLVALDRLCNALLNGRDTETMSSRVYRNSVKGYWYAQAAVFILDILFKPWDEHHCKESWENAYAKGDAPPIVMD